MLQFLYDLYPFSAPNPGSLSLGTIFSQENLNRYNNDQQQTEYLSGQANNFAKLLTHYSRAGNRNDYMFARARGRCEIRPNTENVLKMIHYLLTGEQSDKKLESEFIIELLKKFNKKGRFNQNNTELVIDDVIKFSFYAGHGGVSTLEYENIQTKYSFENVGSIFYNQYLIPNPHYCNLYSLYLKIINGDKKFTDSRLQKFIIVMITEPKVPFVDEVEEFNAVMGKPNNYEPVIPERKEWEFVYNFILEELEEYREACERGDIVEILDALCDITYVSLGNGAMLHGLKDKIWPAYQEVQASNLSKACKTEEEAKEALANAK